LSCTKKHGGLGADDDAVDAVTFVQGGRYPDILEAQTNL
jgi:hypothetical protein